MRQPCLQTVVVVRRRDERTADHERLRLLAAEVAGVPSAAVRLDQRCEHCGRSGHGRPTVTGADVRVGLSRSGDVVVLAATTGAVLGVDVERVGAVAAAPVDAWSGAELATLRRSGSSAAARTALWTAKEAVLKADGRGLRVDLRSVSVRWRRSVGRVRWDRGPTWLPELRVRRMVLDDGALVLAVATTGRSAIRVRDDRSG
jgi:phosphopantetheinyl transferase